MRSSVIWDDMQGSGVSYTTTEEEKAGEKETVKKYLANMKDEIMSKLDSGVRDKQELIELFKLLHAVELVGKYIVETEKGSD